MLKLRVSGTKNDLKTFQRWLERITDSANPNYLILGEKVSEVANGFMNEAEGLFSKITDPKVQEMLLKQIRALV